MSSLVHRIHSEKNGPNLEANLPGYITEIKAFLAQENVFTKGKRVRLCCNEINRNNEIFDIQGNRNPFIDNENFVQEIWGNICEIQDSGSDMDNDGFLDEEDDCPYISGISTEGALGCPDSDEDGVYDLSLIHI